jgi:hypothetical protein
VAWLIGIADEPEMGVEAERGEGLGKLHACGEAPPASSRPALEGEYVELQECFLRLLLEPRS